MTHHCGMCDHKKTDHKILWSALDAHNWAWQVWCDGCDYWCVPEANRLPKEGRMVLDF